MNPNGMRAWRRFARSVRRKQNRASRAGRALWIADGTGRWYRRQQGFFKQRPSVPARVFSPRSLVGMTQGARKRAWVAGRLHRFLFPHGVNTDALEMESAYSWSEIRATRAFLGQRLRPCPGKHGCRNCTRTCGACEDQCPDDTRCPRCGSVMTTEGPFCDGSGVLPAGAGR